MIGSCGGHPKVEFTQLLAHSLCYVSSSRFGIVPPVVDWLAPGLQFNLHPAKFAGDTQQATAKFVQSAPPESARLVRYTLTDKPWFS